MWQTIKKMLKVDFFFTRSFDKNFQALEMGIQKCWFVEKKTQAREAFYYLMEKRINPWEKDV